MLDIGLSALTMRSSYFNDAHIFAHFEKDSDFRTTEFTSDFLSYFGFGSGIPRKPSGAAPDWVHDFHFFQFPELNSENTPGHEVGRQVLLFRQLLDLYEDQYSVVIDPGEYMAFLEVLSNYFDFPVSSLTSRKIFDKASSHVQSNPHMIQRSGAVGFYIRDGRTSIIVGMPDTGKNYHSIPDVSALNIEHFPLFGSESACNWGQSVSQSRLVNCIFTLKSMRPHRFTSKDGEAQNAMIDSLLGEMQKIKHY